MNEKRYFKLVRDRIPEIIESGGNRCRWRVMDAGEYQRKVDEKLQEELAEYLEAGDVNELADLLEVVYAAAEARGCSAGELDAIRQHKAQEKGAFTRRILLETVTETEA